MSIDQTHEREDIIRYLRKRAEDYTPYAKKIILNLALDILELKHYEDNGPLDGV